MLALVKTSYKDSDQLKNLCLGFDTTSYKDAIREAEDEDSQNTGREGLSGPSKLGVRPGGEFLATVTLGGGYYFVPPIPHKNLTRITEQFFDD